MATKKIIFQQDVDSTKGLDATTNNKLEVKVDGTTVQFNGSGQLTATSSGGSPVDASGSVAGVVNLTSMQALGAGDKVINGVRIGRGAGAVVNNTAIGVDALLTNTTGNNNTAIGSGALSYNTTGTDNTAVGLGALNSNTEGKSNTAIGRFSLTNNTTGNNNTAFGYNSSAYSVAASNTTAIGHGAHAEHDNSTAIGSNSTTTKTNQVVLGNNLVTETAIYGALVVGGTSGSAGTTGQVLTSSGPGVAPTWAAPGAGGAASPEVGYIVGSDAMSTTGDSTEWIDPVPPSGTMRIWVVDSSPPTYVGSLKTEVIVDLNSTSITPTGFSLGFTANASTGIEGIVPINQSRTFTVRLKQTSSTGAGWYITDIPYINVGGTTGGVTPTVIWKGGSAPTSGNNNQVDTYTFEMVHKAPGVWEIYAEFVSAATSPVDASDTVAGVVNLVDGQVLGAGSKVIDGVTVAGLGGMDNISLTNGATSIKSQYAVTIGRAAFANLGSGPDWFGVAVGDTAQAQSGDVALGQNATADGSYGQAAAVAIGFGSTATGAGSVAIGHSANVTHDNSTAIGKDSSTTAANQVVLGNSSVTETVINGALVVGGTSGSAGTTGQVLTSAGPGLAPTWAAAGSGGSPVDASGSVAGVVNLTSMQVLGAGDKVINGVRVGRGAGDSIYNTTIGRDALLSNTTGQFNTAFGYDSLKENIGGASNTAIGDRTLQNNTIGNNNTAIGGGALNSNTTGTDNTAIGRDALLSNTTGSFNTAIGAQALYSNTTGIYNTAIGRTALYNNTTGNNNTAIGWYALHSNTDGSNNSALGKSALFSNTTGFNNTAIGLDALRSNTTGSNNTANGVDALYNNTTGNNNTAIGASALFLITTGTNNTAVGHQALFNNTTGTNNTGIGNNAVASTATVDNEITLGNSSVTALRCQVTSITSLSDERDKTDWNYNIAGLKFINDLKPAYFTWNTRDQAKVGIKAAGFSAQDLLRVQEQYDAEHLDLVSLNNPEKLEARYSNLLPVLVKAIQEMSQAHDLEIQNLKSEINELKKIMSSK